MSAADSLAAPPVALGWLDALPRLPLPALRAMFDLLRAVARFASAPPQSPSDFGALLREVSEALSAVAAATQAESDDRLARLFAQIVENPAAVAVLWALYRALVSGAQGPPVPSVSVSSAPHAAAGIAPLSRAALCRVSQRAQADSATVAARLAGEFPGLVTGSSIDIGLLLRYLPAIIELLLRLFGDKE